MSEPVRVVIFTADLPVPSPSPACLKLLTFLRMAGVPYEAVTPSGPPRSTTGKVPYLERADGSIVDDSDAILAVLTAERGITLDDHLGPAERADALAWRRLVEDHLYFALLHHRWLDDRAWPVTRAAYFGSLPPIVRWIVPAMLRRAVRRDALGQGLARRGPAIAADEGARDVLALSARLGERDGFFAAPSSLDAVVYGTLENLRVARSPGWAPYDALLASPNLLAWLDRMRAAWWP